MQNISRKINISLSKVELKSWLFFLLLPIKESNKYKISDKPRSENISLNKLSDVFKKFNISDKKGISIKKESKIIPAKIPSHIIKSLGIKLPFLSNNSQSSISIMGSNMHNIHLEFSKAKNRCEYIISKNDERRVIPPLISIKKAGEVFFNERINTGIMHKRHNKITAGAKCASWENIDVVSSQYSINPHTAKIIKVSLYNKDIFFFITTSLRYFYFSITL